MKIIWADSAGRACRDVTLERLLKQDRPGWAELLPELREQLTLLTEDPIPCFAVFGVMVEETEVPLALLAGDRILLLDFLEKDASAAAICAKSDRLTMAARSLTLFHGPSEGRRIQSVVLLRGAERSATAKCGMSQILPFSRLAEYVRFLKPQGETPQASPWAAAPCEGDVQAVRARIEEGVERWMKKLFGGWLKDAAEEMNKLLRMGYRIYNTTSCGAAREYCQVRFEGTEALYGFLTSSKSRNMLAYGAPRGVGRARRIATPEDEGWEARWFEPDQPEFCRTFSRAGLETTCEPWQLNFAILGWGDDMRWAGRWKSRPEPGEVVEPDPDAPVRGGGYNIGAPGNPRRKDYQALLRSACDGLILYTPAALYIDSSRNALLRAGVPSVF